ncbi:MAG: Gfo/Idh/MocA family oxidoreductase [Planctomycetes bacterium]|nr:Gfo/Idh/MocA family oxidoreductase [Planctomycetota bacterium]
MTIDEKLGVAVVGMGIGRQHALAYKADPACRLVKLFDLDAGRSQAVAKELGLEADAVADSYEQILDCRQVDIVSIASYDDAHYEQVLAAIGAGKHVFVEKPLCGTLDQAGRIKKIVAGRKGVVKLGCNLVLRAAPLYVWLRREIQAGRFGEIYAFDGEYLYGRLHKITDGWRKDVKDYSVMLGGGIHIIDLMLWLTGLRPASVFAAGNRICSGGTAFAYDDFSAATFMSAGGPVARITANFGCVHEHQHVVRIYGTKGTFLYDDAGPRIHDGRDGEDKITRLDLAPLPASKGDLIPVFVRSIQHGGGDDPNPFFDGISLAAAADLSLKSGKIQEISYA